jgi:sugar phosphate isomerase/epimerase
MIRLSAFADEISPEPAEQLDVLDRHGIKHIEFRSIHKTNVLDLSPAQHEEFRGLLRSRGFGLSAIGSPIGKIQIGDPFEPHLERFEVALKLAEFYETPRVRIFSYYLPREDDPAIHRDEVMRRMIAKARIAEKRGIALLLENERYIYGDNAARVLDVLETVDSPALSHAFDPANYLEIGQDVREAWEALRDRVTHFHVKDYDLSIRKNVVAGQGQGLIPELIANAVSRGYDGFCTLEPHLVLSELTHGFTGPDRFGDAAVGLQSELKAKDVAYA